MTCHNHMVLTDVGLFCEGMYISAGIYYLYKGNYVLLSKDTVFTSEMVEKLGEVSETYGGIYVYEDNLEEIWNESIRQFSETMPGYEAKQKRVQKEYTNILSKTGSLLGGVLAKSELSVPMAENISESISRQTKSDATSSLLNCIHMIHEVDDYLYTHCVNVATLNGIIGKWMGLSEDMNNRLIKVGLLHDLGKLKIPPRILNKPGKLTDEEFSEIKKHPLFSYEMIIKSGYRDEVLLSGVRQHHERIHGEGYPNGLRDNKIHLAASVTAVSDVYDAMVSKRCYKDAITPFEVLDMLSRNCFSGLHAHVVKTFLENIIYLFVGTKVKLSNGEQGEVVFIKQGDYAHPIVKVGDKVISTNDKLKCVSIEVPVLPSDSSKGSCKS